MSDPLDSRVEALAEELLAVRSDLEQTRADLAHHAVGAPAAPVASPVTVASVPALARAAPVATGPVAPAPTPVSAPEPADHDTTMTERDRFLAAAESLGIRPAAARPLFQALAGQAPTRRVFLAEAATAGIDPAATTALFTLLFGVATESATIGQARFLEAAAAVGIEPRQANPAEGN